MKVTRAEAWSAEQFTAAKAAVFAHGVRNSDHVFGKNPRTAQITWDRVVSGVLLAALCDGYLLVYDVGPTWCTEESLLYELLLVRALPGGTFQDAIAGMHDLAKHHGCYGIHVGNGVLRPGLRKLYERAGFGKLSEAYYLEVDYGKFQRSAQEDHERRKEG